MVHRCKEGIIYSVAFLLILFPCLSSGDLYPLMRLPRRVLPADTAVPAASPSTTGAEINTQSHENVFFLKYSPNLLALKVVGNEKEGGSGKWQMIGIGLGLRQSIFVCLLILLYSLTLCISVSTKKSIINRQCRQV